MPKPLLSIVIPTYNRAKYLDKCLGTLLSQFEEAFKELIEVMVSDNCSDDNTYAVVSKYQQMGFPLKYNKNPMNIGMDGNIIQSYKLANGKYVQILGDDDIWLPGKLSKILELLKAKADYGLIYMASCGYQQDFLKENTEQGKSKIYYIKDKDYFLEKVSYEITFLSGLIFNKALLPEYLNIENYKQTNIPHVGWFITSLLLAQESVVIDEHMITSKQDNSGGYNLFEVFAKNFNKILKTFVPGQLSQRTLNKINLDMLRGFFPKHFASKRFGIENSVKIMDETYAANWYYKIFTRKELLGDKISTLSWFIQKFIGLGRKVSDKLKFIRFFLTGKIKVRSCI